MKLENTFAPTKLIIANFNFKTEEKPCQLFIQYVKQCGEDSKGIVKLFHKLQEEAAPDTEISPTAYLFVAKAYTELDKPDLAKHFLKLAVGV